MEPIKKLDVDEKLNTLASEIGQDPELFDEDAWLKLFDASMLEAQRQKDAMSPEEQEAFTAKDLAGFEQVKKRMESSSSSKMTLEELWEKSAEIEAALTEELKTESAAKKKPISWRKRKKAFLLAAAVIVLGLGTTMMVQGDRAYELKQYPMLGQKNVIAKHNSALRTDQLGELVDAYNQIQEALDIDVFELGYIPEKMKFRRLIMGDDFATLEFDMNGKISYFNQRKLSGENEVSDVVISDRNEECLVYNEWLNKKIVVEKNRLENGFVEYSAGFNKNNVSYYVTGIMDEDDFVNLVKEIHQ